MALIHCPDCEREVSSRATACPHCAYPINSLTNLFDAALQNDTDMLRDLLRAGQNPNEANEGGISPLLIACQQGSLTATKLLVNAGANINHQDNNGLTPLMEAALQGYEPLVRFLLEHGADQSLKTREGQTARDLAISEEYFELANLLGDPPALHVLKQEQKEEAPSVTPEPIVEQAVTLTEPKGSREVGTTFQPPSITPPPLPEEPAPPKRPIRFIDDTVPVIEDERYTGAGLICKSCRAPIKPEDIWCGSCKAPIIRRYCGGCHELIPEIAAKCPYCNSSKVHRFRYIRHLEQIVAGGAVLAVLLFVMGIYNPQDSSSYARKLAEQRSQQQEQKMVEAEQMAREKQQNHIASTRISQARSDRAVARMEPRDFDREQSKEVVAREREQNAGIPTVERIEEQQKIRREEPSVIKSTPEVDRSEDSTQANRQPDQLAEDIDARQAQELNAAGFRLMKRGRYAEAIPILAEAVRSFPPGRKDLTYAYALYNLGRSLRLVGRPDLAVPILEERMKIPDQREVVAKELDQARSELEEGVRRFEDVGFE